MRVRQYSTYDNAVMFNFRAGLKEQKDELEALRLLEVERKEEEARARREVEREEREKEERAREEKAEKAREAKRQMAREMEDARARREAEEEKAKAEEQRVRSGRRIVEDQSKSIK